MKAVKAHKSQVDETLIRAIYELAKTNAQGFDMQYEEPLRLLDPLHTHCFAVPVAVLDAEPISIYE